MKAVKKKKKENIWVLIYTKAKEEKKATDNLRNQGFKTFLPLIAHANKNDNFKSLVPLFPRYLFVQVNLELDNLASIKSSYGVSHIVMFSNKLTFIPNNVIKFIQDRLDKAAEYKEDVAIFDYHEGDRVSIKEGLFAGLDAIFLSKKSKDRVRLLLNLLNTSTVVELTKSDIGNKEVIKNFQL